MALPWVRREASVPLWRDQARRARAGLRGKFGDVRRNRAVLDAPVAGENRLLPIWRRTSVRLGQVLTLHGIVLGQPPYLLASIGGNGGDLVEVGHLIRTRGTLRETRKHPARIAQVS